jgi:hypothetical protein
LTFFGRFNRGETSNIQVAAIMVYNRKITQDENTKNNNFIVSNYISKLTTPSLLYLLSPNISTGTYYGIQVSQNKQYVLLCTNYSISVSSNSGSTFSFNSTITNGENSFSPVMSTSGQYMYFILQFSGQSRAKTICKSSNYGSTWVSNNIGSAISKIICNSSGSSVWAIEYTTGAIYQSTDYGTTYTTIYTIGANLNLGGLEYNATLNNLYIWSCCK